MFMLLIAYRSLWTVAIVAKSDSGKGGRRKQRDKDGHSAEAEAVISSENKKRGCDG